MGLFLKGDVNMMNIVCVWMVLEFFVAKMVVGVVGIEDV